MRKRQAIKLINELYKSREINSALRALSDASHNDIVKLLMAKYIKKNSIICINSHSYERYELSLDASYADKRSTNIVLYIGKLSYSMLLCDVNMEEFIDNVINMSSVMAVHT